MHDRAAACRHHLALGHLVTELVRADALFEVVATPRFGLTCFRPKVRGNSCPLRLLVYKIPSEVVHGGACVCMLSSSWHL